MTLETLLIQGLVGISSGMILFIVASGLSLIFGVMRVINFAHGSFYMLAAFLAASLGGVLASEAWVLLIAIILIPIVIGIVGALTEVSLIRRTYGKEHLLQLLLTYGITLIGSDLVRIIWGGGIYRLQIPEFLSGSVKILERRFPVYNFALMAAGISIAIGLRWLLRYTRWGRLVRASVTNPEMVQALGINIQRLHTSVFALGCFLAGIGGVLIAGRSAVSIGMDSEIIVQAFAVVVIGGLGSISGALAGSLLIGVVLAIGTLIPSIAGISQALPFIVMAIVLIVRPYGLQRQSSR